MRVPKEDRKIVYLVSVFIAVMVAGSALIVNFVLHVPTRPRWDDLMVLGIIVGVFPAAITGLMDKRWRNAIDKNMPYLIKEISEGTRAGLSFPRAIESSAQRQYGPLTKEIKRVVAQLSWGATLDEALRGFADRADTPSTRRTTLLLLEASRSGGNIQEILEAIYDHTNTLDMVERERKSRIRPFIWISYMAFAIFVGVGILIFKIFFSQIAQVWAGAGTGLFAQPIDIDAVTRVFFHMAIIEAFVGGLIAGKMGDGSVGAGLKHALVLMVAGYLVFYFFVW